MKLEDFRSTLKFGQKIKRKNWENKSIEFARLWVLSLPGNTVTTYLASDEDENADDWELCDENNDVQTIINMKIEP